MRGSTAKTAVKAEGKLSGKPPLKKVPPGIVSRRGATPLYETCPEGEGVDWEWCETIIETEEGKEVLKLIPGSFVTKYN